MINVFISQPMKDKTDEQNLAEELYYVKEEVVKRFKDDEITIIIPPYDDISNDTKPLWILGRNIQTMSTADVVYFIGDWRKNPDCKVANYLCKQYDIKTIEE